MTGPARLYRDDRLFGNPRWVLTDDPSKLMRVPDDILDSVCFVCYYNPDGALRIAGTAFFVGRQPTEEIRDAGRGFVFALTCKHVIVGAKRRSRDGRIYLRVNYDDEGTELIHMPDDWKDHPTDSSVDCVAQMMDFGGRPFRYTCTHDSMAATEDVRTECDVGVGDTVFFAGLFYSNPGRRRNIPIVRMGTIAAMPEERVSTSNFGDIEAILVEARSIGGLSGSPVFVELRTLPGRRMQLAEAYDPPRNPRTFGWAGMVRGHWDVKEPTEADGVVGEDDTQDKINTGIAVVIPVDRIMEVLDHPGFKEGMERVIMADEKESEPTEDIAPDTGTPGPEPERLKIDAPFDDAVEKALRKKKPKEGWPEE